MSSKTKKKASCGSCVINEGNGTCHVDIPMLSAMGWKSQICATMSNAVPETEKRRN